MNTYFMKSCYQNKITREREREGGNIETLEKIVEFLQITYKKEIN